jgi:hypothetical protein
MITIDRIYLVVGGTSEYSDSDHDQWNVAAYVDIGAAEQHAKMANDFLRGKPAYEYLNSPYDNRSGLYAYHTKYIVEEVEIVRHVDEYQDKHPVKVTK